MFTDCNTQRRERTELVKVLLQLVARHARVGVGVRHGSACGAQVRVGRRALDVRRVAVHVLQDDRLRERGLDVLPRAAVAVPARANLEVEPAQTGQLRHGRENVRRSARAVDFVLLGAVDGSEVRRTAAACSSAAAVASSSSPAVAVPFIKHVSLHMVNDRLQAYDIVVLLWVGERKAKGTSWQVADSAHTMAETSLDSRVTPPSPPLTPPPHSVSASAAAPGAGDDSAAKRAHQLSSPDILIHGRDTGIQGAVLSVHAHPLASPLLDGTTAAAAARDLELGSPRRGSASGAAISAAAREGAPRMQHRISSGPGRDIYLRDEDSERDPLLEQARLHGAAQLRRLDDNKTLAALRRPLRHRTPWRGATTQAQGEVSSEQEQRAEEEQEQHQQQQREDLERSMRADADKATTLGNKKGLRGFYASQNTMIESLLKSMDDHARDALDEEAENRLPVKIAVVGSFICNWCVFSQLCSSRALTRSWAASWPSCRSTPRRRRSRSPSSPPPQTRSLIRSPTACSTTACVLPHGDLVRER